MMDMLSMRPYAGDSDLAAMQALLRATPSRYDIYPTASDLAEALDPRVSATRRHTAVWEDGRGHVVGFAFVTQHHNLLARFSPRERIHEVGAELIDWAVDRLRLIAGGTEGLTLDAVAREDDEIMMHFLANRDFVRSDDSTIHMIRRLSDPLPDIELPADVTIRGLDGDAEVPAYVAVHHAAYGTEKMTEERRRSIMRQPHYDPELDLVAVTPDDALAAFCVSSIDSAENARCEKSEGEIAIVGVHPDHRGRQLGRAVVLAGLHALQRKGIDTAMLTVAGDNRPAIRVYEGLGFRPDWHMRWYARPLVR